MKTSHREYSNPAKWLHWLMAALIIVAAVIGYYGASLVYGIDAEHNAQKVAAITLHKSIATITLFLIVARVLWRVTHRPPALSGMPRLMVKATHFGHFLLYAMMIVVPVSGWANSSSAGYNIPVAGLFNIPQLLAKNTALTPYLSTFHEIVSWGLVALVVGHVAFALKHYFVGRDDTLASMSLHRH